MRTATRDDFDTLTRLNQLYRYDLSEFSRRDIGADATFDDAGLAQYVDGPQYCGHFFYVEDALAGFGLVNLNSHSIRGEVVRNLDDFFVLRKWRRQGVGSEAARLLLSAYPGRWQVNKRTYNPPAMAFWARVVENAACGEAREHIAKGDIHMHIFRVAAGQPG